MKTCDWEGEQEKCDNYDPKDEKGKDFTCLYYREMWHRGFICDQEYPDKKVSNGGEEDDG